MNGSSGVMHVCTQHVQIGLSASLRRRFTVRPCIMGASFAYGGEAAGQGGGVPLPTDGSFILGLSEPAQEVIVGRWSGGERGPSPSSPSTSKQSTPDFVTIPACVCMFET